jgi:murein endopeptidase
MYLNRKGNNMKKIILIIIVLVAFAATSHAQPIEQKLVAITETISACEEDSDCVHVGVFACGCHSGGQTGVINKKFEEEYYKKRKKYCW